MISLAIHKTDRVSYTVHLFIYLLSKYGIVASRVFIKILKLIHRS